MPKIAPIPLSVVLELIEHHDDDRMEHMIGIFGAGSMLAPELDGTDRAIPDVTTWLETQFLPSEADLLKEEFRRHMAFIAEIERNLHDHSR